MNWSSCIGLGGDVLTFVGGIFLALEAIKRDREFDELQNVARSLEDPTLAMLSVEVEGVSLSNPKSAEKVYIHRNVRVARWGATLLSVGFFCLLVVRVLEIRKPSEAAGEPASCTAASEPTKTSQIAGRP